MTDRQNSKLNMYQTTIDTCNEHRNLLIEIPVFDKAFSDFEITINNIRITEQEQEKNARKSASLEKGDYEGKLVNYSIKVANILYVYAFDNKLLSLLTEASVNKSNFYNEEGNKKLSLAKNIFQTANNIAPNLAPYGVTTELLDNLRKAILGYEENIVKPRDATVQQKKHTQSLKLLFATADSLLYDKLDKLIVLFKDSNQDFYNEYISARNIINTSLRHKKKVNDENE
ncbi:MAG: hypothetical protein LBI60_00785 [Bacteroidales bacterium]|jgi:hypothetical protein|nr:hypothetical protein [Bacteroidales bacterium]